MQQMIVKIALVAAQSGRTCNRRQVISAVGTIMIIPTVTTAMAG